MKWLASVTGALAALIDGRPDTDRSPHWPRVRAGHLKAEPTCAACGTREHLAVHHIWPFGWPGGDKTELDPSNLITLCESPARNCHLLIGHLLDYRSRNPSVVADALWFRARITNRPYPRKTP